MSWFCSSSSEFFCHFKFITSGFSFNLNFRFNFAFHENYKNLGYHSREKQMAEKESWDFRFQMGFLLTALGFFLFSKIKREVVYTTFRGNTASLFTFDKLKGVVFYIHSYIYIYTPFVIFIRIICLVLSSIQTFTQHIFHFVCTIVYQSFCVENTFIENFLSYFALCQPREYTESTFFF